MTEDTANHMPLNHYAAQMLASGGSNTEVAVNGSPIWPMVLPTIDARSAAWTVHKSAK